MSRTINEFFENGHQQQVDLDEKFHLMLTLPNQSKDDSSIIYSTQHRRPMAHENLKKKRRSSVASKSNKVSPRLQSLGFVNMQARLTNKVSTASAVKPKMKLGIFNHFCRSACMKLKSFSEEDMLVAPVEEIAPVGNSEECTAAEFVEIADKTFEETVKDEIIVIEETIEVIEKSLLVERNAESEEELQESVSDLSLDRLEIMSNDSRYTHKSCCNTMNNFYSQFFHSVGFIDDQISSYSSVSDLSVPSSVLN